MKISIKKHNKFFLMINVVFITMLFVLPSPVRLLASRPISIIEKPGGFEKSDISQYSIIVNEGYTLENECPTLAYLNVPDKDFFKNKILNQGYMNDFINDLIKKISREKVENIVNTVIEKELEMHKKNYVFYHGMLLEFLLYQDLFSLLFKLCEKKELKNFFMLRNPLDVKNYKDLDDLSKNECKRGALSEFKKGFSEFLLSVVPSLFSYTYSLEPIRKLNK